MKNVVVTGAARGIGLELCRQLKADGFHVIATCRQSSSALDAMGVEIIDGIELGADDVGTRLAQELGSRKLELLVNNAGIMTVESLEDLDYDRMRLQFEVNALGPLRVTRSLLPNLSPGSKVVVVTSRMGSMGDNGSGGYYGYRMSKAAVNAAGVSLARDLKPYKVTVLILHPGLVATDMTGRQGVSPAEAAANLLQTTRELGSDQTGSFHHATGDILPW